MWEISTSLQIKAFLVSIFSGFGLCLLYGMFSSFRIAFHSGKIRILFEDIVFFSLSAFITFVFLMAFTNGEIRGYFIMGEIIGFCLMKMSLYKFFVKALIKIISLLKRGFSFVSDMNLRLFNIFSALFFKVFKKI